jgi:hypothetical protein
MLRISHLLLVGGWLAGRLADGCLNVRSCVMPSDTSTPSCAHAELHLIASLASALPACPPRCALRVTLLRLGHALRVMIQVA